jgi:hypothetical protein
LVYVPWKKLGRKLGLCTLEEARKYINERIIFIQDLGIKTLESYEFLFLLPVATHGHEPSTTYNLARIQTCERAWKVYHTKAKQVGLWLGIGQTKQMRRNFVCFLLAI